MKKIALFAACCSFALAAWGQPVFQPTGKSLADLHEIRTDETVVTAEADINKDGIKDIVIALDGYYSGSNFAFYFGDKDGGYKLFREYETSLYGSKTGITVTVSRTSASIAVAVVEAIDYKFHRKTLGKRCFVKRMPQTSFGQ